MFISRLIIRPDNTFEVSIDYRIVNHGSLFDDFEPSVNPPQEIDDPNDFKPEDWDEREKIPDPEAKKPEDWDESQPRQIEVFSKPRRTVQKIFAKRPERTATVQSP